MSDQAFFSKHAPGCYADDSFGHAHVRSRLAQMLRTLRLDVVAIGRPDLEQVETSLRGEMPDDAWDEYEALDVMNAHTLDGQWWDIAEGGLYLVDGDTDEATDNKEAMRKYVIAERVSRDSVTQQSETQEAIGRGLSLEAEVERHYDLLASEEAEIRRKTWTCYWCKVQIKGTVRLKVVGDGRVIERVRCCHRCGRTSHTHQKRGGREMAYTPN